MLVFLFEFNFQENIFEVNYNDKKDIDWNSGKRFHHVRSEGHNIAQSEANYPKGDHIMLLNDTHCFEVPRVNLFHG